MRTRLVMRGVPMVLLISCLACSGPGFNPATGTVTHKGSPVKGAVVIFHPKDSNIKSQRPSGVTDDAGAYTLTTGKQGGAIEGEYVVTITWPEEKAAKAKGKSMSTDSDMGDLVDRLQGRYADSTRSKLTAVIKGGSNTIPPIEVQ